MAKDVIDSKNQATEEANIHCPEVGAQATLVCLVHYL